jgi:hypothetical protein
VNRKLGLVIGNSAYRDSTLSRLATPDVDVGDLADVLLDAEIGGFDDVKVLVNASSNIVRRAISNFFASKDREDLLLLYFSGHGVLDMHGRLFLAVKDTERPLLRATAIPAAFITDEMNNSRSQRQLLILDCCHSGAFARGTKGSPGASVGTSAAFEGTGYGRVVLTATDATQYAWEGEQAIGEPVNSVFTHHLIGGLQSGAADANKDGLITIDELYDYAYGKVLKETPNQTPGKWTYREQGEIVIAQNPQRKPITILDEQLSSMDEEADQRLASLYTRGLSAYWLEEWDSFGPQHTEIAFGVDAGPVVSLPLHDFPSIVFTGAGRGFTLGRCIDVGAKRRVPGFSPRVLDSTTFCQTKFPSVTMVTRQLLKKPCHFRVYPGSPRSHGSNTDSPRHKPIPLPFSFL